MKTEQSILEHIVGILVFAGLDAGKSKESSVKIINFLKDIDIISVNEQKPDTIISEVNVAPGVYYYDINHNGYDFIELKINYSGKVYFIATNREDLCLPKDNKSLSEWVYITPEEIIFHDSYKIVFLVDIDSIKYKRYALVYEAIEKQNNLIVTIKYS